MNKILTEVKDRVLAETPTHFIRIRNVGIGMLIGGLLIKGIGICFPPLLPVALISFASDLIGYGSVIAGISQTARK